MASNLLSCAKNISHICTKNRNCYQIRFPTTTASGAIFSEPNKIPFGLIKVAITVMSGLYIGATISKTGAAFLEENDIFVPEDDDGDDD